MKVKDLFDELQDNDCYKNFILDNPTSYLSAGFFILDYDKGSENLQLDFFIPEKNRVAGFEFPFKEAKIFDDHIAIMGRLILELKVDIDDLKSFCDDSIHKNNSSMKVSKIIAIIKGSEWNITCMDNFLGIIRLKIDALTGITKSFDKGSIMDFAKTVKK